MLQRFDPDQLDAAAALLRGGGVLAYPTEAVYGLGCDPHDRRAFDALFALKQRPPTQGVLLIAADFAQLERYRAADPVLAETICGYHLEGPFMSPEDGYRGAHPAEYMQAPDLAAFRRLQEAAGGNIRLLTLAPERLADADRGEAERGWVTEERLAERLRLDRQTVKVQIHRARQELAAYGVPDAAGIVERRAGSGQLRIGVARVNVRVG